MKQQSLNLYRLIWRWHFYAGVFCLPLVLALSVSGAIYLFKPQIDQFVDQPYRQLEADGVRASANEHIQAALNALPGSSFVNYQLPQYDSDAVVVSLSDQQQKMLVYVHPYTLKILKVVGYEDQLIRQVRTFHGELLAGNVGSVLVELAGCWAIVLIISGLYLWWPRDARGLAGIVYPRLYQGGRLFWRDLHAVIGLWISALVLFLLVSGLPWTLVWGSAFKELRQLQLPVAAQTSEHQHHPTPAASWSSGRAEEAAALVVTAAKADLSEQLLASAAALQFSPPVMLAQVANDPAKWKVTSDNQNRMLRDSAWLDASSGEVVRREDFSQLPLLDRLVGIGVSAHEGQLFGWFNQLLGVVTAGGLVLMCVSGFVMWRKRKPGSSLGAPPALAATANVAAGKVVTAITLLLALLLPVLGQSLIALALIEWLLLRRSAPLRAWLGLRAV